MVLLLPVQNQTAVVFPAATYSTETKHFANIFIRIDECQQQHDRCSTDQLVLSRDAQRASYCRRRLQQLPRVFVNVQHRQKVDVKQEHVLCVGLPQCHVTQVVDRIELLSSRRTQRLTTNSFDDKQTVYMGVLKDLSSKQCFFTHTGYLLWILPISEIISSWATKENLVPTLTNKANYWIQLMLYSMTYIFPSPFCDFSSNPQHFPNF